MNPGRAAIFSRVRGQERAARVLGGFLKTSRIPSTLLFSGPEGTGKTLMALEFAKALLCRVRQGPEDSPPPPTPFLRASGTGPFGEPPPPPTPFLRASGTGPFGEPPCGECQDCLMCGKGSHPDLTRVNPQYQAALREEDPARQKTLRVETIRRLRRDMEMRSLAAHWKIAIVEEAHTLEIEAANALLKILEEPNPGALWILTSSRKERLPKTVLSRCFAINFAPLSEDIVREWLIKNNVEPRKAQGLARLSGGSLSRALELAERPYPGSLSEGPLGAVDAAESLPRELPLARTEAELALFALAQDLRLKHLEGRLSFPEVERPLRNIKDLQAALRSNADPRLVLALAGLEAEAAKKSETALL